MTVTLENGTVMTKKLFKNLEKQTKNPESKAKQLKASLKLAECFGRGIFVEKDNKKAAEMVTLAALLGDAASQRILGLAFVKGNDVEQNYETAVHWYSKAAAQGNAKAQSSLGFAFEIGRGVEQNYK